MFSAVAIESVSFLVYCHLSNHLDIRCHKIMVVLSSIALNNSIILIHIMKFINLEISTELNSELESFYFPFLFFFPSVPEQSYVRIKMIKKTNLMRSLSGSQMIWISKS